MNNEIEKWRVPRFFSSEIDLINNCVYLCKNDEHHAVNVLRLKTGDKVIICDTKGTDYYCSYIEENRFKIVESALSEGEPDVYLRLFQCLPKSDKMDFIVQKAVELGVSEIIPVISSRCVSRPGKSKENKEKRWNKIAYEAAKQCGRGIIPVVSEICNFNESMNEFNKNTLGIIFYECGGAALNGIIKENKNFSGRRVSLETRVIDIWIGSEGGFEREEIELASKNGLIPSTLGKRILRVETAPVTAISVLMNLTGNL
jgi:16S rRNA (uracil1498-N3)-methyltransferase